MRGHTRAVSRPLRADSIAARVGERIRSARLAAGLTQQQLAGERYTKAYVSALENAHVKPSMTALEYLAGRLGTSASRLLASDDPHWARLDADLQLAAGRWREAADAYQRLLEVVVDRGHRGEVLRGLAEALLRLGRAAEAERAAAESAALFEQLGQGADAALARFWLAGALYGQDNPTEAGQLLQSMLRQAGRGVEPGFRLRVLMALVTNEQREGNHAAALAHLDEIRALADALGDRRRAAHLFEQAYSQRRSGDVEAALRAGHGSLALFDAARAQAEMASTENALARAQLALGNSDEAAELVASARARLAQLDDQQLLAHVIDTDAQVAAARDEWPEALRLAGESLDLAERSGNQTAVVSALLTMARAHAASGEEKAALAAHERAGSVARELGQPALIRRALGAWADALATSGDHAAAYDLSREALAAG